MTEEQGVKFFAQIRAMAATAGELDPEVAICLYTLLGSWSEGPEVMTAFAGVCGSFSQWRMQEEAKRQ